MKSILVTGAGGYVGSVLVKKLIQHGYFVRALDLFLYDKFPFREIDLHQQRGKLEIFKADIRDTRLLDFALIDIDVVIHLACISNDPSFDLNPALGKSVNLDAFEPLVRMSKQLGVKRFINASSSSVYGISPAAVVKEDTPCAPLTDYSRFKLETEKILKKFSDKDFVTVSIRSATVCGYSPRQRLDVIVNIFANHAFNLGKITVTGGDQKRPNVHIDDITDLYVRLVEVEAKKINDQVFNYGGPNHTVSELADLVKDSVSKKVEIVRTDTKDPRSYHISSAKIFRHLGLAPKKTIKDAVKDLELAFIDGRLKDTLKDPKYFNIEKMKEIKLK